jgi:hypothetical protein
VDIEPVLKVARIDPLRVQVIAPVSRLGTIEVGDSATVVPKRPWAVNTRRPLLSSIG